MTNIGISLAGINISGIRVVLLGDIHLTSSTLERKVDLKIVSIRKDIRYTIHLFTLYHPLATNCLVLKVLAKERCILYIIQGLLRLILHLISISCLHLSRIIDLARVLAWAGASIIVAIIQSITKLL